ncbi:MAG: HEPN domain-containing protein [Pirellulales bacterium]|nr:HEPN domain-containing protein [Pirellulales bacterium]
MNRTDFKRLTKTRLQEVKALLNNHCWDGAYYLSGYIIECALKACIAKQTRRHDFPDRKTVNDSYTHDLTKLIVVSGMKTNLEHKMKLEPAFELNWQVLLGWNENSRYEPKLESEARGLFNAIVGRKHGVLTWIKRYW